MIRGSVWVWGYAKSNLWQGGEMGLEFDLSYFGVLEREGVAGYIKIEILSFWVWLSPECWV